MLPSQNDSEEMKFRAVRVQSKFTHILLFFKGLQREKKCTGATHILRFIKNMVFKKVPSDGADNGEFLDFGGSRLNKTYSFIGKKDFK